MLLNTIPHSNNKIIKSELLNFLKERIGKEVLQLKSQLQELSDMSANETKSSAGDKYETGLEMIKQEQDKLAERLQEAMKKASVLERLKGDSCHLIQLGSIVQTPTQCFFISIPLGKVTFQNREIFCLSVNAPIVASFVGKKQNDSFVHQGKEILILDNY